MLRLSERLIANEGSAKVSRCFSLSHLVCAVLSAFVLLGSPVSALAYGESDVLTTLKSPLIPTAPNAPSYGYVGEGQPPPIGDGFCPPPVTPGHFGAPCPPPSALYVPPVMGGDKGTVNAYAAPYLTPPPSGDWDPGMIHESNGGAYPPATWTNINPGGGISGSAPICRWDSQKTQDHGRNINGNKSYVFDFGESPACKPDVQIMPQISQDGPRAKINGGMNGATHCPNLPNAQATAIRYGNRIPSATGQKAKFTIAPY